VLCEIRKAIDSLIAPQVGTDWWWIKLVGGAGCSGRVSFLIFPRPQRRPAWFAKVAWRETSARALATEFAAVQQLHAQAGGQRWVRAVPRPLGLVEADGIAVMVTNALPGKTMVRWVAEAAWGRQTRLRRSLEAAVDWLSAFHEASEPVASRNWLGEEAERFCQAFPESAELAAWVRAAYDGVVPPGGFGRVHGDFNIYNILTQGTEVCGVFDWEHSREGHPLAFDLLHLLVVAVLSLRSPGESNPVAFGRFLLSPGSFRGTGEALLRRYTKGRAVDILSFWEFLPVWALMASVRVSDSVAGSALGGDFVRMLRLLYERFRGPGRQTR